MAGVAAGGHASPIQVHWVAFLRDASLACPVRRAAGHIQQIVGVVEAGIRNARGVDLRGAAVELANRKHRAVGEPQDRRSNDTEVRSPTADRPYGASRPRRMASRTSTATL